MIKRFYKEVDGRWYIDLPEYIESGVGTKSNLEMVAGADTFLSTLAQGETTITLKFEDEHFIGHHVELIRSSNYGYASELMDDVELDPGAWYHYYNKRNWYELKPKLNILWLCPVLLFLFNNIYPENIFIE
jgi:hypothetical protein